MHDSMNPQRQDSQHKTQQWGNHQNSNYNNIHWWPNWAIRRVMEGTCRGLIYLHSHDPPIVHRGNT